MRKSVLIGIGIAIVAITSTSYLLNPNDNTVPKKGAVDVTDSAQVELPTGDTAIIADTANSSQNGLDYTINEQGKKNYVITATDSPDVSD